MSDLLQNFSQVARDSYEDVLRKIADNLSPDAGGTNFTVAGNLTVNGSLITPGSTTGTTEAMTSIASIATANIYSPSAALNSLVLSSTVLGNATTAPLKVIASTASQTFFDFQGAVISTASLNLAANQMAGIIHVRFIGTGGQGQGFIPIFKGVV